MKAPNERTASISFKVFGTMAKLVEHLHCDRDVVGLAKSYQSL